MNIIKNVNYIRYMRKLNILRALLLISRRERNQLIALSLIDIPEMNPDKTCSCAWFKSGWALAAKYG